MFKKTKQMQLQIEYSTNTNVQNSGHFCVKFLLFYLAELTNRLQRNSQRETLMKYRGGYLSRQVVFHFDVSLLKAQTEVWILPKFVDLVDLNSQI